MEDKEMKFGELKLCMKQLYHIDDSAFKSSTLFFTINSGLIIAIASLGVTESNRLLIFGVCFIGYYSSLVLFLTIHKLNYYGWEANKDRVEELEKELGFKIGETYRKFKKNFFWKKISVRNVRDFFNLVFVAIWIIIITYLFLESEIRIYFYVLFVFLFIVPIVYVFVYESTR